MRQAHDEMRRKRLLYQAQHRGFKEADLVIGEFAAAHLASMSATELAAFEALLAYPDHDLYAWATGDRTPPGDVDSGLVSRIRAFDVSGVIARKASSS